MNGGQFYAYINHRFINYRLYCISDCCITQEGKSNGLSGAISGGAEQLFGKQNNVASIYSCID